jgi:hypothetical protein
VGRPRTLLVGIIVTALLLGGARSRADTRSSLPDGSHGDAVEPIAELDEAFSYGVAARFNERIVANIDAIDTSLTTILAGNVALLVLLIDKIKELAVMEAALASACMCVSTAVSSIAYVLGFSVRGSDRDGLRPRILVPDMTVRPKEALIAAVVDLMNAGEANLSMRSRKKGLAVLAIVLLLVGAVVLGIARAKGSMV